MPNDRTEWSKEVTAWRDVTLPYPSQDAKLRIRDDKLRITEVKIIRENHTEEYFEYDIATICWRYDQI